MEAHEKYGIIVQRVKEFFHERGYSKAVLGLSGGLDSSLTAVILKDALGKENVYALLLPEAGITSEQSIENAVRLSKMLDIYFSDIGLNQFLAPFRKLKWDQNENAALNTKARLRMCILYNYANSFNALVVGTSNKSELTLGYGTKYGDLGADVLPLGGLFKTEVIELARHKNLPKEILNKKPSAELKKDQTDEADLGASYRTIDTILKAYLERGLSLERLKEEFNPKIVESLAERIKANQHKLCFPPIIEVSE